MSDPIILLAKIRYSDGQSVRTIGVSDAPYFGDATGLDGGCWWPLLDPESDQGWGESARHPWQGQNSPFRMGDLTLINTGRHFDEWTRYTIAGMVTELQRGPANATWNDEPDRFDTFHPGKMEPVWRAQGRTRRFEGRERLILSFESLLAPLAGALNTEVFDEATPNPTLINRPTQLVLGQCFQLRPFLLDGNIKLYHVADDITPVATVQEGGNPDLPIFEPTPAGFQLFAKAKMAVTCDATGPVAEGEQSNVLDGPGDFDDLDGGDPVGWDVRRDLPWSDVEESASGHLLMTSDSRIDGDTGWVTAAEGDSTESTGGVTWQPVGESTLAAAVDADDSAYARLLIGHTGAVTLRLSDWDFGLTADVEPVGLELRIISENTAGSHQAVYRTLMRYPDGTARRIDGGGDNFFPATKQTEEYGSSESLPFGLSKDILEDASTRVELQGSRVSSGMTDARVYQLAIKVHFGSVVDLPRITRQADDMVPGQRYLLRIHAVSEEGNSARVYFGGVSSHEDAVPGAASPFAVNNAQIDAGIHEFSFVAQGPRLAIEIDRGDGNGVVEIERIELIDQSNYLRTYSQLVPYIVELANLDPELHVQQDMIDAHDLATGEMQLGWLVSGSETADDVLALFAGSLGGMLWHDRGGRVKSMLLQPPDDSDDDILHIEDNRINGEIEIWDDTPEGMTDRATAATNWHPIAEDRSADALSEQEKANVAARHRVVRRAKFPDLEGFTPPAPPPGLTLTAIDPNTGDEAGGTAVTLTGTGFADFDTAEGHTWTIGGEPVTSIAVVSDTEMTGETPAGTGSADVVVTIGEDSATLEGGFVYGAAEAWEPEDMPLISSVDFSRSELTFDGSNVTTASDLSGNDKNAYLQSGDSGPTIVTGPGGVDVADFNGTDQRMRIDVDVDIRDCHIFIVAKGDEADVSFSLMRVGTGNTRFYMKNESLTVGASDDGFPYIESWASWEALADGDNKEYVVSGSSMASFTDGNAHTHDRLYIGGGTVASDFYRPSRIAYVAVVPTDASVADIERLQGWAAHRFGFAADLPASHPYKGSPP